MLIDGYLVGRVTGRVREAIDEPLVRPSEEVGVTPDRHPRLMPVSERRESGRRVMHDFKHQDRIKRLDSVLLLRGTRTASPSDASRSKSCTRGRFPEEERSPLLATS